MVRGTEGTRVDGWTDGWRGEGRVEGTYVYRKKKVKMDVRACVRMYVLRS